METAVSQKLRTSTLARRYTPPSNTFEFDLMTELEGVRPVSNEAQRRMFDAADHRPGKTCFGAGDRALLRRLCVAVVGAREATALGLARASRLARELVEANVVVVSGLARGIDTAALTEALARGGRTIGVIGTPLDKATPVDNSGMQEEIYSEHLLVTPFALGTKVQKHFFPIRNRVMAAMADATVIVEASETSGTLHQAVECQKLGRWLFIARSVVEDPNLTWPARFLGQPRTAVLTKTDDLLAQLR